MKIKLSNIIHWLLLASLLAFLGSCGNMSSVRNGKYIVAKSEKIEEIKNIPSDSLLIAMSEKKNDSLAITGNEEKPVEVINEIPSRKMGRYGVSRRSGGGGDPFGGPDHGGGGCL